MLKINSPKRKVFLIKRSYITRDDFGDPEKRRDYQRKVLELQEEQEKGAENRIYICDRGIDNLAYAKKYPYLSI
jgi:hypothetical protein